MFHSSFTLAGIPASAREPHGRIGSFQAFRRTISYHYRRLENRPGALVVLVGVGLCEVAGEQRERGFGRDLRSAVAGPSAKCVYLHGKSLPLIAPAYTSG